VLELRNLFPGKPSISANTEYERILVEIWQEVLDIRPIGTRDNFLDLGGHSLAATRIASRVLERFRLDVPLHALFQTPTIVDMAIVITLHQGKTLDGKKMSQLLTEIESLTEEQARQFLDRFGPTGP
jgi:acyl carrier protein